MHFLAALLLVLLVRVFCVVFYSMMQTAEWQNVVGPLCGKLILQTEIDVGRELLVKLLALQVSELTL